MSLPVYEPDHVAKGIALLLQQWRTSSKLVGILATYLRIFQDLEDVTWDVINSRMLDTAVGAQLDMLGDLVGESRRGRNDIDYRAAVRLRIRVNRSQGRAVDVIDIATQGSGAPVKYREYPESFAWEVELVNPPSPAAVAQALMQAKAAGSRGYVIYTSSGNLNDYFRWSSTASITAGSVWPSATGSPVKKWSGVFPI